MPLIKYTNRGNIYRHDADGKLRSFDQKQKGEKKIDEHTLAVIIELKLEERNTKNGETEKMSASKQVKERTQREMSRKREKKTDNEGRAIAHSNCN